MTCPRCMQDNVTSVNNTHYVCNNTSCVDDSGKRTQFEFVIDEKINFPHSVIFKDRALREFYTKPYLDLPSEST